jgi:hypothetical protein
MRRTHLVGTSVRGSNTATVRRHAGARRRSDEVADPSACHAAVASRDVMAPGP